MRGHLYCCTEADLAVRSESALRPPFFFCSLPPTSTLHPSMRLVDCEGVECEKQHALWEPVETAMKMTMRYEFDVFRANLQCCIFLRSPLGSSDLFFFWKPCRSNLGPSRDSGWKAKNWGPFEGCTDSDNLVTMEVFGNVSTKRLSMPHDQQMARYLRRFEHRQRQAWAKMQVSVGLWLRMYGYSSLHTNAKARESSKNT